MENAPVRFFEPGTTTPVDAFAAEGDTVPLVQPVRSSPVGDIEVWLEVTTAVVDVAVADDGTVVRAGTVVPLSFPDFVDPVAFQAGPPGSPGTPGTPGAAGPGLEELFVPALLFTQAGASTPPEPAVPGTSVASRWATRTFPDSAVTIGWAVGGFLPSTWTTVDTYLEWTNPGFAAGDVLWRIGADSVAEGAVPARTSSDAAVAAGTTYQRLRTPFHTGLAVTPGGLFVASVFRDAGHVADTLTGNADLIGLAVRAAGT